MCPTPAARRDSSLRNQSTPPQCLTGEGGCLWMDFVSNRQCIHYLLSYLVIARIRMYVMFLLRQRRLNKLINYCGHYFRDIPVTAYRWRVMVLRFNVFEITGKDNNLF